MSFLNRLPTLLNHPNIPVVVILIAMALVSPSLFSGLVADDYVHYALFNGGDIIKQRANASFFDLYSFVDGNAERNQQLMDYSLIPWWTVEHLKYNFWRPISELFHFIDYVIFKEHLWAMHLQSMAWFCACLFLLLQFYQKLQISRSFAVIALALFAWDSTHGVTIAWIANRNALIAAFFTLLVLQQHINFSEQGKAKHLILAIVFLVFCLLSAETGIAVGAYLFAYAIFLDKRGATRGFSLLLPYAVVVAIWWFLYKYYGYGASGSIRYYIDPVEDPTEFIIALFKRIPLFFGSQFGILPSESRAFGENLNTIATLLGFIIIIWVFLLARFSNHKKQVAFLLTGTFLAMFPITASLPQDRNLLLVGIGGSGLAGLFILDLWSQRHSAANLSKHFFTVSVGLLVLMHLILSPLLLAVMSMSPAIISNGALKSLNTLNINSDNSKLIIINGPVENISYLGPMLLYANQPNPAKIWNFSSNQSTTLVKRVADNQLRIRQHGGFLQQADQVFRHVPSDPMKLGQQIQLTGADISVTELLDDGRPAEITVTFAQNLSKPEYNMVYWHKNAYHSFSLANGESIEVPGPTSGKARFSVAGE